MPQKWVQTAQLATYQCPQKSSSQKSSIRGSQKYRQPTVSDEKRALKWDKKEYYT